MFKFKISSDVLNNILKRVTTIAGGDTESSIIFLVRESDSLEILYKTKLDKGEVSGYFCERVSLISSDSTGRAEVLVSELAGIKIPELNRADKYPYTKFVEMTFKKTILNLEYDVSWGEGIKDSKVSLKYKIKEYEPDTSEYDKLSLDIVTYIDIEVQSLLDAIEYCNFFKNDVTSSESNGCYLQVEGDVLTVLGTDSNTAAKYCSRVLSNNSKNITKLVISNSVFKLMKVFISGVNNVKLSTSRSSVCLDTGSRRLMVPAFKNEYLTDNIDTFLDLFKTKSTLVSKVQLKPISSTVSTVIYKSDDHWRRTVLKFSGGKLDISAGRNYSKDIPSEVMVDSTIHINGTYVATAIQRLLKISEEAFLYYSPEDQRLNITSEDGSLVFLIQALKQDAEQVNQ